MASSQFSHSVDFLGRSTKKLQSIQSNNEESMKLSVNLRGDQSCEDQPRRYRTNYSRTQISRLEDEFVKEKYLSRPRRTELAQELGLKESTIKVWFQNRRMKEKRQLTAMALPVLANSDPNLYAFLMETANAYMNYTSVHGVPPTSPVPSPVIASERARQSDTLPTTSFAVPSIESSLLAPPPAGNQSLFDLAALAAEPRLRLGPPGVMMSAHNSVTPFGISGLGCFPPMARPAMSSLQHMVEAHLKHQMLYRLGGPPSNLFNNGVNSGQQELKEVGGTQTNLTKIKLFRPFFTDDKDD